MYAVSYIATACTIDGRFVQPWQPLKSIFIKNIYVREFSYTTLQKYINLRGLSDKKNVHAVSLTIKSRISSRFRVELKKAVGP
jgi:hypothetical protein